MKHVKTFENYISKTSEEIEEEIRAVSRKKFPIVEQGLLIDKDPKQGTTLYEYGIQRGDIIVGLDDRKPSNFDDMLDSILVQNFEYMKVLKKDGSIVEIKMPY